MISIIVRTKNEERWIGHCLRSIFDQDYKDFEVIIVDNKSTDKTIEKAKNFDVKVVTIDEYRPGFALNEGIRASKGDYIVCLSAHCLPVKDNWLTNLMANFNEDEKIAGAYGRQEPMAFSSDFDKRDLLITFGLDKRIQVKDSFFHNANSIIRRDVWNKIPFNESVSNIEDRLWAEQVLKEGYKIAYEPEASVLHYHGIHQDQSKERCAGVVRVLETMRSNFNYSTKNILNIEKLNTVAIVPIKGESMELNGKSLLEYTIKRAKESKYLKQVIVTTDNEITANHARQLGAEVPFIRDEALSEAHVDLEQVLKYSLEQIEERNILPDILVLLEPTFPFREKTLIDDLIYELVSEGLDTVIPAKEEFKSLWKEEDGLYQRIDDGFTPREFKKPVYTGIKGLGCVTHSVFVREGNLFGNNVGMHKISNPYSSIEVRSKEDIELASVLMKKFWKE